MVFARSRVTAQGQISIPAEVRKKLGVGPGSVLEWKEEGDKLVVERSTRFSSSEIHNELFETEPEPKTLNELKDGIRQKIRKRYARR
jgi:AbrB family looped-hinge helix DNA binding protein